MDSTGYTMLLKITNLKNPILSRGTYLNSPYMGVFPSSEAVLVCKCLQRNGWVIVSHMEKFSLHHQHKFIIFLFTSLDITKDLLNY